MQSDELVEVTRRAPFSALFGLLCSCKRLASTPVDRSRYTQVKEVDDVCLEQYPNGYRLSARYVINATATMLTYVDNVLIEMSRTTRCATEVQYFDLGARSLVVNDRVIITAYGVEVLITYGGVRQVMEGDIITADDPVARGVADLVLRNPMTMRTAIAIIGNKFTGATQVSRDIVPYSYLR